MMRSGNRRSEQFLNQFVNVKREKSKTQSGSERDDNKQQIAKLVKKRSNPHMDVVGNFCVESISADRVLRD
jgi:hypothetical protein